MNFNYTNFENFKSELSEKNIQLENKLEKDNFSSQHFNKEMEFLTEENQ